MEKFDFNCEFKSPAGYPGMNTYNNGINQMSEVLHNQKGLAAVRNNFMRIVNLCGTFC